MTLPPERAAKLIKLARGARAEKAASAASVKKLAGKARFAQTAVIWRSTIGTCLQFRRSRRGAAFQRNRPQFDMVGNGPPGVS